MLGRGQGQECPQGKRGTPGLLDRGKNQELQLLKVLTQQDPDKCATHYPD